MARLTTRVEIVPLEITTPWLPEAEEAYKTYFGESLEKGNSQRLVFSLQDAELPFVTQNEGLWNFFEPQLRKRLSELTVGATMAERVRGALLELLPLGSPAIQRVARTLAVSTRTLQRQLKREGTTFQKVLARTREALARHYLANSGLTTVEISFLLGYEEPTSFYRAFRGWTGETPDAARSTSHETCA